MSKKPFLILFISVSLVITLPIIGILLSDKSILPYLEFPPMTRYQNQTPFSWLAFWFYAILISVLVFPFLFQIFKKNKSIQIKGNPGSGRFPWWGYVGTAMAILAWVLAWTRFHFMHRLQPHTFSLQWLAYIIIINALTVKRTNKCMLTATPFRFFLLFPVSALFWWLFEYLNRFVKNWYYIGASFSPFEYFWYATLSFATVLPAVIGTREYLLSFSWPEKYFNHALPIPVHFPRFLAWMALITACSGLTLVGIFPYYLFPLLWISPLAILLALQTLYKRDHLFSMVSQGCWILIIVSAMAALICGFFWEMWNFFSLAKWKYQIPFVHRFCIFEMPILGYAGYLPFGLECSAIADLVVMGKLLNKKSGCFITKDRIFSVKDHM